MSNVLRKNTKIKIDGYNDIVYITSGGNSNVYKCKKGDSLFALKIIKFNYDDMSIEYKKRIENEINFQKTQKSQYIIKIIENGFYEIRNKKYIYYIMPYYKKSLLDLMRDKTFNKVKLLELFASLCTGLKYAHDKNVIHRDIKPENIMYDETNDKLLLADFGIAHFKDSNITKSHDKLANFKYASPEQRNFNKVDYRTDIFSLGLILNEIFTGKIPDGVEYEKISLKYPAFSEIDDIVKKMIYSNPDDRVKSIITIQRLLKKFLEKHYIEVEEINAKISILHITDLKVKNNVVSDFIFANYILKTNNDENYNICYHNNVLYSLDESTLNTYFILYFEKIIKNYFNFENTNWNSYNDWLNENKIEKEKLIEPIKVKLSNLKIYKAAEANCSKIMKLLYSLYLHNLEKISNDINIYYIKFIELNSSLSIIQVLKIMQLLKKNCLLTSFNIIYFINNIKILENKSFDNKLYADKILTKRFYNQIEDEYGIKINIELDNNTTIYFESAEYKQMCFNFFENVPAYMTMYGNEITILLNKMKNDELEIVISNSEFNSLFLDGYFKYYK